MNPALTETFALSNRRRKVEKIIVATGSSGGHIFPALSFLEAVNEKYDDIKTLLVLPQKNIGNIKVPDTVQVRYVSINPVSLNFTPKNLISIFCFLKGSLESLFLLVEFSPDIVVGFGSVASIPVLFFAWIFRIETLIHEQNVLPGRANKLLAKFADKVAVSFPQTKDYLWVNSNKIVLTGNPIRKELKRVGRIEALDFFGFDDDKFTLLVTGGSLGSHNINLWFLKTIKRLNNSKIQVIHICGESDFVWLKGEYKDLNIKIKLFAFFHPMQYAYSCADLAISRAGAATIHELMRFELASILIPYPFAYAHQIMNAQVLENIGAAIIIEDRQLQENRLGMVLEDLLENPEKLKLMRQGFDRLNKANPNELLMNALNL